MENNNHIEDKEIDLLELIKTLWGYRISIFKWTFISMVVGVIIAFSIPKEYQVVVKIAPESSSSSSMSSKIGGLAALAGVNMGGESMGVNQLIYPEIIASSPFLGELATCVVDYEGESISFIDYISDYQKRSWFGYINPFYILGEIISKDDVREGSYNDFYPDKRRFDYEKNLSKSISLSSDKMTNINTITVTMQDPIIAAVIADSILSKLQKYMVEYQTSKTKINLEKLSLQLAKVEKNYYDAEKRYAEGVDQNRGLTMESAKVKLSRLENEKNIASDIYQQVAIEKEMQQVKLGEQTPIATIIQPSRVPIKAEFPSKLLFMIGFGMLGALIKVLIITFKENIIKF